MEGKRIKVKCVAQLAVGRVVYAEGAVVKLLEGDAKKAIKLGLAEEVKPKKKENE